MDQKRIDNKTIDSTTAQFYRMASTMTRSQQRHARRAKIRNSKQQIHAPPIDAPLRNVFLDALRCDLHGKYLTSEHQLSGNSGSIFCFTDKYGVMRSLVID